MADFPRVKWVNFDGNTIPFTEPQHFTGNGDETVRTGHDNPLPVANYTQNESGLWLPTSKENPMPTQVTGSIVELFDGRNIALTSGSSVELYRFTSGYDFRKYRMSCRLYSPYPNQWKIEIKYFVQESDIQPNALIKMDEALVDDERYVGIESNTFSDIVTFNAVNESTTDTTIGRSLVLGGR